MVSLVLGDCLEKMNGIPDGSVDLILCDPPYGTTSRNDWDIKIPLVPLWEQYKRVIKDNGAILLFAQMPFGAELTLSNPKMFRYEWIWEKSRAVGYLNANRMPLRAHENILVFYKRLPTYNPQKTQGKPYTNMSPSDNSNYNPCERIATENKDGKRYPRSVLRFKSQAEKSYISVQKPVPLLEYLIKTYTNEGETVIDNCMGSGSTGIAAINTNRDFIGIEKDPDIFKIAEDRIKKHIEKIEMTK